MNNSQKLLDMAMKVADNSYSPYSNFAVGCAIFADNRCFYSGCNVENVSFPVGTCAEEAAIAAMIADGGKKIVEILVYADAENLISPCGACRQRILEFADDNTMVYMANTKGIGKSVKAMELLPFVFKEF
ncbi:MAG: cytidine deaminase [Alphaproteobacteria bacterium]|nr:cytidine deaminase [Alphaproteobacteria bacterium]